jgi:4-deoxy-L-threo-5-hexosulose-uronate ketol-isomerase
MKLEVRYANHPNDSKHYTTEELRKHYLVEKVFEEDDILLVYSHQDRIICGGVMPVNKELKLETSDELRANFFLERRELGIINIGGDGEVILDGKAYQIKSKDGMYVGMGTKDVVFKSKDRANPAKFYIASSPAHKTYPTYYIDFEKANHRPCGEAKTLNKRVINQYIHPDVCPSCQLAMGMTELAEGSGWNTMPSHTHERRMEVYFYFNLKDDNVVFHMMGQPQETRHIVMNNEQLVISPSWSIHSGIGTSNYTFIWAMCGENQEFDDMDNIKTTDLK